MADARTVYGDRDRAIDCSIFSTGRGNTAMYRFLHNYNAPVSGLVSQSDHVLNRNAGGGMGDYGFGAYHVGICNFLKGDGSVISIQSNILQNVLWQLADVSDGGSVGL
jgi:hypothetical protein